MHWATNHKFHSTALRKLARFRDDEVGLAAVEFAYILPLMLLMFLGAFEVSRAISMDRKLNAIASITGDLVAREESVDDTNLGSIMTVINHVLAPYDPSNLRLAVIPVLANNNDPPDTFVYAPPYEHGRGMSVPGQCASYDIQNAREILTSGDSVIVVEAEYDYEPVFVDIFAGLKSLFYGTNLGEPAIYRSRSLHSPRQGCIDFQNSSSSTDLCGQNVTCG